MADIGAPLREVTFEPVPEPMQEPVPAPVEEPSVPEPVPA